MRSKFHFPFIVAIGCMLPADCLAQAFGSDMVNQEMKDNGLFHPHANNCASSEVFVPVGSGGTGGSTGFCMDKDETSGAGIAWEDCRQACASLGKRLPEPIEFKIACQLAPAGLVHMTDNQEWVSNFAVFHVVYLPSGGEIHQLETPLAGSNGRCDSIGAGEAMNYGTTENINLPYRCVH